MKCRFEIARYSGISYIAVVSLEMMKDARKINELFNLTKRNFFCQEV